MAHIMETRSNLVTLYLPKVKFIFSATENDFLSVLPPLIGFNLIHPYLQIKNQFKVGPPLYIKVNKYKTGAAWMIYAITKFADQESMEPFCQHFFDVLDNVNAQQITGKWLVMVTK